ncbi:hypothetical protein [Pseudomonas massiliensis]|uniref:hypothetical protein n=1 Tax=Pseudomonas massiliensis TaxID=522492 RepID=UPI000590DED4|nr:hypothetical protein [Pseudomonas massiliensis]
MATRKPAASTLLKQANEAIAKLTKELESTKGTISYHQARAIEATKEIEDVHAFCDALPNVVPRKDDNGYNQRSVMTRLAAWLATK